MLSRNVRLRNQEGSITVLIAFLLPIMLLMLALVVNINHLVFQKIRLQNIVDACALSAAAVQAAGLNEIADLNLDMMAESEKIKDILNDGVWHSKNQARKAKKFFSNDRGGVIDCIYKYQMEANIYFAAQAHKVAIQVKDKNLPQAILHKRYATSQLAEFRKKKKTYRFRYYSMPDTSKAPPRPTQKWNDPDRPEFAGSHHGEYDFPGKRKERRSDTFTIPYKLEKLSLTIADYYIRLPARPSFPLANHLFGGVPELRAQATAKPKGGDISIGFPKYRALLIN